jgi:hypothetical protein
MRGLDPRICRWREVAASSWISGFAGMTMEDELTNYGCPRYCFRSEAMPPFG